MPSRTPRPPKESSASKSFTSSSQIDREVTVGNTAFPDVTDMRALSHEEIAQQAYQLWEQRGRTAGQESQNWYDAEQLLRGPEQNDRTSRSL